MVLVLFCFVLFLNFQEKLGEKVIILMKTFLRREKSLFHNPLVEEDTRKSWHEAFHLISILI